jgi:hypothetical protein
MPILGQKKIPLHRIGSHFPCKLERRQGILRGIKRGTPMSYDQRLGYKAINHDQKKKGAR